MKSAVIVFPGSNCDRDVAVTLEDVTGKKPVMVWHGETSVPQVDLIVLPGGFSYGDYLRSGAMAAHSPILRAVRAEAERGVAVLGICNGFQILTEARLLPGALMRNASLGYICRDVGLKIERADTPFTNAYAQGEQVTMPIAHKDGAYFADEETLDRIEGDGQAVIFKMESHNHPSYIEPYQGAATGVGGIMRDVFTMGARPIASLNALRFGSPDHPKTRHLVAGVVSGIGDYGNCMGIPTVGGETNFDAGYDGNILVNAMCVGLASADRIFYSAAAGAGNPVVYVGSKTGRDGIHGATMASAEFDEETEEKRPTVQVGDPFAEKLLLEACLELMAEDAILAIQDMGAAGLTLKKSLRKLKQQASRPVSLPILKATKL